MIPIAVTVKHIAARLGISPATVSLALNNRRGVGTETRQRVLDTAREMGYIKTTAARPAAPTGFTIHFVIFKQRATEGLDTSFFSQMMEGVQLQADQIGANLMISYIYARDNLRQRIASLSALSSQGVILLGTELTPDRAEDFLAVRIPLVVLDAYYENLPLDCVTINNAQGAYAAATYLAECGHRHIGYLTSKIPTVNFTERHDGLRRAFRTQNIDKHPDYAIPLTPSIEGACADMKAALADRPALPTAFFADNDIIAAGAMRALKEMGLRVPEDISLVGFDDIPLCTLLDPPLTTLSVPKARLGELAVNRLHARIEQAFPEFIKIEVGTTLVERATVARR